MDNTLHRNDTVEAPISVLARVDRDAAVALAACLTCFVEAPDSVRYVRLANVRGARLSRVALVFDVA